MSAPATLAQLLQCNQGLRGICGSCGHVAELDTLALSLRFGESAPVPLLGSRLRCSKCGHLGGRVQVVAVRW